MKKKEKNRDKEIAEILKKMNSFTSISMAHEAEHRHEMTLRMANAIITGKIDSEIVKYAEMLIDVDEREKELFK